MDLRHIVAATDESDAGRQAVRTAIELSGRASARLTILRVTPVEASRGLVSVGAGAFPDESGRQADAARLHLRRWLEADVLSPTEAEKVELGTASGIPGIEICRFADRVQADLLVLGRKRHSTRMRLLLGDTADAVARRSRYPCLFVPQGGRRVKQMLVALDGSDRGDSVLDHACDLAQQFGASLRTITVERAPDNEPLHLVTELPIARSMALQGRVREAMSRKGLPDMPLAIRRGDILERVIAEAQKIPADVLVVGYHRGGPPGVLEAGSTARRLVHASTCAVLTIPL